ncbi:TonB-dependent receptor family protein [Tahibacter harae]|uniref:TonB-dependent receptor n=1 Tax=Tahibacter harae TaxID=2963937 RepID=A0ABT1QV67_9GAMM|nr:TonB-dependent receptor [Tahibacter harae]MCQ4166186.1 TonB-dependent receptor [Tahibacter harae]
MVLLPLSQAVVLALVLNPPPLPDAGERREVLPRIEVEATTQRAAVEAARRRLDETAGGAGVIDAERYREQRASTLADALGYAAGVFVQPRFGSEESRLSIRGSGLQRTFHLRGLELLQDGVYLNQADGGGDFQAVEPLAARYIEVYRGANALQYGAAALGGAVNFVSPTGRDVAPLTLRLEGGSFGYGRAQAAFAGSDARQDYYASLSAFGQDGFRDHAQQETYRFFSNYGVQLDGGETRFYLSRVDTHSALPGSLTRAELESDPRRAAPGNLSGDQRRDFALTRLANRTALQLDGGGELEFGAFYAYKHLNHPIFQVLVQDSRDAGVNLRWRHEAQWGGRRSVFTAGAALIDGSLRDRRYANIGGARGAPTNAFDSEATRLSVFAEQQYYLTPATALVFGLQALRNRREAQDRLITGGRDESYARSYSGVSPKLGLRHEWADGVTVFGNISRSYEPPSFGELAGGPQVTLVDAQKATSGEIGLRVERAAVALDAALYRADMRDELLSLSDADGNPRGTVNAPRTRHQGMELSATWRFADSAELRAAYLLNDFRFDGDAVYGDNRLAGVAPQLLRAELRWSLGRWYLAPTLEWSPQRSYIDHANSFAADSYAVAGLRVGGEAGAQWRWFVDARNLGDRRYAATTGVIADALGRDSRQFLPGDGRSVFAGIEWRR